MKVERKNKRRRIETDANLLFLIENIFDDSLFGEFIRSLDRWTLQYRKQLYCQKIIGIIEILIGEHYY